MVRCFCRWRSVLICVCTPCVSVLLLMVYVMVALSTAVNNTLMSGSTGSPVSALRVDHFVAPGTSTNGTFSRLPKTFWELGHKDAIWNRLQTAVDRRFNPILRPNGTRKFLDRESLIRDSFSGFYRNFAKMPPLIQDFVRHMHRRDYPALIQPPGGACGAGAKDEIQPPLILFAVKSTELNFKNRQAIRQTWGQAGWVAAPERDSSGSGYVRRVFLVARGNAESGSVNASELLRLESERYGDILQWDFRDTFFNLTLKDVLFWRWFSLSCGRTRFVFKGDDDVFVNTPKLMAHLQEQLRKPNARQTMKDFLIGDVISAAVPNRAHKSKYFIPETFYKGLYPSYAGGGGVVYSGLLTRRLHLMSRRVHLFPIDDVYVGMCLQRLNAQPLHHHAFLTFDFPPKEEQRPCRYHSVLLVHRRSPQQLTALWAELMASQTRCWDTPLRNGTQGKGKEKNGKETNDKQTNDKKQKNVEQKNVELRDDKKQTNDKLRDDKLKSPKAATSSAAPNAAFRYTQGWDGYFKNIFQLGLQLMIVFIIN